MIVKYVVKHSVLPMTYLYTIFSVNLFNSLRG